MKMKLLTVNKIFDGLTYVLWWFEIIPNIAMHNIRAWNDMRIVCEIVKEVRRREDEAAEKALMGGLEQSAGEDGSTSPPGQDD